MTNEQEQMSNGSAKRIRVAAHPIRSSELEAFVAVTEPELNSQTSSEFATEFCAIFRQLAKYRQRKLSQVTKNQSPQEWGNQLLVADRHGISDGVRADA
jgi:hypothetical protein